MKISIKKTASLSFLLLWLIPLLFILSFSIQQQVIRHRMKERLEEQLLQSITIADKDVYWVEKGKEILVDGKMFDVETIRYNNRTTTFTGLYDEDETLLMVQLNETWNKNSPGNNQLLTQLFKCLHTIFYNQSPDSYFLTGKQHHLHNFTFLKLLNQFTSIPTPPPQA